MIDRRIVFRSGLSLVVYAALAGGTVVAQDAPGPSWAGVRSSITATAPSTAWRMHPVVAYSDETAFLGLKTPTAAYVYHAYLAGLRAVEYVVITPAPQLLWPSVGRE